MRTAVFAVLVALAGIAATEPALAHGGTRVSVGVGFGFGYPVWGPPWGPWYWPPPYYYPVPVVVRTQPVTYVEQRSAPAPASAGGAWWYYCDGSKGYYPYVKECPSGWQRVSPVPAK